MQLNHIDKARFKKRLNWFQGSLAVALVILSVAISQLYIFLWSTSDNNFWFNAAGVASAVLVLAMIFTQVKGHPFLYEVLYVAKVKKELQRMYRNVSTVEKAMAEGDKSAYTVNYFYLHGSRWLMEMEDNTITMDDVNAKIRAFDAVLEEQQLSPSTDDYQPEQ